MKNEVINNKIESLRKCLQRIESKKPFTILRKLNYINEDVEIRMKKAVGFRNIAVHAYQDIDWEIVYSIVTENSDDFVEFIKQIIEHAKSEI